nr:putative reverse transcriptase domain-containing protein [Tanacetum cinerariifolium]
MLKACVIDFSGSLDVHLPLVEFSYNNSYHSSIWCAPFEALYGRKCRSPVLWAEIGEGSLIKPELVLEMIDKVVLIKKNLKAVRDRQKSYVDKRRKTLEFEVGDRDEISSRRGYCNNRDLIRSMISLEVFDHLILSAFVSGDEYFICSRLVIMERNGVLHAMQRQ